MNERQELKEYILWHMWKARNSWLFNRKVVSELDMVQQGMEEWMEYADCQQKLGKEVARRVRAERPIAWQNPAPDHINLNMSSVWEGAGKPVGQGIIARNHHGTVEQAWSVIREEVVNPVVAETDAVRVALVLAQRMVGRKWRLK